MPAQLGGPGRFRYQNPDCDLLPALEGVEAAAGDPQLARSASDA
jgi:hypothetical protein